MSGFEIVGVVLGAFPIVLEGLKFYLDSKGTFQTIWRPKMALDRLYTLTHAESIKLQNSLEKLLTGIMDRERIKRMWDTDNKEWSDKKLHEKLTMRLQDEVHKIPVFLNMIGLINQDLNSLIDTLGLGAIEGQKCETTRPISRARWKEIKIILMRKDLGSLLEDIFRNNQTLDSIICSLTNCDETNLAKLQPINAAKHYKPVRNHASRLYSLCRRKLSAPECECNLRHFASMQLETRRAKPGGKVSHNNEILKFKIILSFERDGPGEPPGKLLDWVEVEFAPSELLKRPVIVEPMPLQLTSPSINEYESKLERKTDIKGLQSYPPVKARSLGTRVLSKGKTIWKSFRSGSPHQDKVRSSNSSSPNSNRNPTLAAQTNISIQPPAQTAKPRRTVAFAEALTEPKYDKECPPESSSRNPPFSFCKVFELLMKNSPGSQLPKDLGTIDDEQAGISYNIHTLKYFKHRTTHSQGAIFLDELLEPNGPGISRLHRTLLAIQLASSVLQLYETGWLSEIWGKRDIFFLTQQRNLRMQDGTCSLVPEPILTKPLVCKIPAPARKATIRTRAFELANYNETVYSLGLVLAELALEKRLEDIGESRTISADDIGLICHKEGQQYTKAIGNCLWGLGMGTASNSLENSEFQNEFYEKVVVPLEAAATVARQEEGWE